MSGIEERTEMSLKSMVLCAVFMVSSCVVEDANGLLVLGVYVLETFLGGSCPN